jgi:hypothetical protein
MSRLKVTQVKLVIKGIICDVNGQWVSGFSAHISYSSTIVVEICHVSYGLEFASDLGFRNVKL